MAAGDGISMPTTLSQMGSVAKTQAKGQQAATHTAPVPERMQDDEDLRVNRVKDEYVRRVDLDGHIVRLDRSVNALAAEMRNSTVATNQRLDAILAHFASQKGGS